MNQLPQDNNEPTLEEVVNLVAKQLDQEKGLDVQLYDTSEQSSAFGYIILTTALSALHMKKLASVVEEILKGYGWRIYRQNPLNTESGWLALDYGDFVIHLFTAEQRSHYNLEEIMSQARRVE